MCGIHGVVDLQSKSAIDPAWLRAMGNVTAHRGPDDHGEYSDGSLGIGMRRLSIIDLAGGHQPLTNADGSLVLVCNGEIYNFRELRRTLQDRGSHFKTGSDSEVILHAYAQYGDDFLRHIDGMFGFALWDRTRKKLMIARDRVGIKPLYYYCDGRWLAFASELKALIELPFVERELDPSALSEYVSLGYVPTPKTMFQRIFKLPPATMMTVQRGQIELERYWSLPEGLDESLGVNDWATVVRKEIDSAVRAQMVSDVPLGAFLSGGIDSSAVVAAMAEHSAQPVRTYSIGFAGSSGADFYNELPYAQKVAARYGTQHREILVNPDVVELLPKLIWHLDEPMADTAFVTTYLVSEFARQDVTVILSGVGGDELYGGYRRYLGEYYGTLYDRVPGLLRRNLILPIARRLPSDRHSPLLNLSRYARNFVLSHELDFADRYRSYVQVFDRKMRNQLLRIAAKDGEDALDAAFTAASDTDFLRTLFEVDAATQLPDDLLMLTDKMSMAVSLECRVPLLHTPLVEQAARMPAAMKIHGRDLKHVLKKALAPVLPHEILYRKKRGFGAPMGAWIREELAPMMSSVLAKDRVEARGLLDWPTIEQTVQAHESRREDHTDHLLALMNLELWCQLYLDGVQPHDLTSELKDLAA